MNFKKKGQMSSNLIYLILAIFVLITMIGLLIYFKDDIYAWIKNLPDYDSSKDEEIGIEGARDLRTCEIRIAKVVDSTRKSEVEEALKQGFIKGLVKSTTERQISYEIKDVLFCLDKNCDTFLDNMPLLFLKEKNKLNGGLYYKINEVDYKDSYLGSVNNGKFSISQNLNEKIKKDSLFSMFEISIKRLNNAFYEELFICEKKKT